MFLIGKHGLPKTRTEFERALRDGFSIFRAPDLRLEITGEFPRFENKFVSAQLKFNTTCLHETYLTTR